MCPSSRSWPLKSNRKTGQNTGRGFPVVVVATVPPTKLYPHEPYIDRLPNQASFR
jgi:hypothetical protein